MGVRGGVFTLSFARLNLRVRNHLYRALMRQEIGFFDENHTGDLEPPQLPALTRARSCAAIHTCVTCRRHPLTPLR